MTEGMRPLRFASVLIACRDSANGRKVFVPCVRGSCRPGRSQLPAAANERLILERTEKGSI